MKIIWKAPDDAPPTKGAIEWAVRAIATRSQMTVPDDATLVLDSDFIVGSYPLVLAAGPDGEQCWFVDYDRILDELVKRTDAEMRAVGEDPGDATDMERQTYRLIRRSLIHWPEEQVRELHSVLMPIITELIEHVGHDHDDEK